MKITCDVIEDLMPLYVDDVASQDSRKIIEEHLIECELCRKALKNMKESIDVFPSQNEKLQNDDKIIISQIKNKILKQFVVITVIAAVLILLVCVGNYLYYDFNVYVDYEKSGVFVEDEKLYVSQANGYCTRLSPDGKVEFVYLKDNPFREKDDKRIRVWMNLALEWPENAEAIITDQKYAADLEKQGVTGYAYMPELPLEKNIQKIYYMGKGQENNFNAAVEAHKKGDSFKMEQMIKEVEDNSVLLWERSK